MSSLERIVNIQLWGIKVLIFFIPLISLYVSSSMFFPYITGKNFAFRILVELATALWLGLIVFKKDYRLRNSPIVFSILLFTFVVGIADLFGINPYNSFWSNYERMEGYITILHLLLYFMVVKSVFRTKMDWRVFFNIYVAVGFFVAIFALIAPTGSATQTSFTWEYGGRILGTLGNPPFLASYLLLSVFLGIILIFDSRRVFLKYIYLIPVILNSIVIYLTSSRGAILAGITGIVIFVLLKFIVNAQIPAEKIFKRVAILFLCLFLFAAAVFLVISNTDIIKHDETIYRFTKMFSDESGKSRFNAWRMAWNAIKERPFLGWGQENFLGVYNVNPIPFVEVPIWIDRAHNIVIKWLINAGIPGLLSYLAIFGSAFYLLRKAGQEKALSKNMAVIIFIALIVYFIQNLFTFDTINTYLIFFALLAYIDNLGYLDNKTGSAVEAGNGLKKTGLQYIGATLISLLIFCSIFYYMNYKPIKQMRLLRQINTNISQQISYTTLLNEYNRALSYKTFGDYNVRYAMTETSRLMLKYESFDQEGASEFLELTLRELDKGIVLNKNNLEYLSDVIIFLTKLSYYDKSFSGKAESLIKQCMIINPEYQWLYVAMADINVMNKDYEKAFVNVKRTVALDPEHDKKQFKLALAAILTSRDDVLRSALGRVERIRMDKNSDIASGRMSVLSAAELNQIADVYMKIDNYHKALQYLEEIAKILSDDNRLHRFRDIRFHQPMSKAYMHIKTARVYSRLGKKENAIEEAEKALKIDPENFAKKAESIISRYR